MKIEVDTVKGFQDYLPPESLKRNAVQKIIEKWYRLYGFLPVETPVVEFDELMKPDSLIPDEDEAVSDRFRLKDRAGRNLGLRYEFTFQLARILKQNPNLKLPFRRYQIGPVFRDEPTGTGRFRQFIQCDADIIGSSSIDSDAECLSMVSEILKELKIEYEIIVNNRKLISAIIESVEIPNKKAIMREIDKLEKLGEDNVKTELRKYADANQIITLFKLLEKPLSFFQENKFDGSDELADLLKQCKKLGLPARFSPFMIRGFGYYTGNIFEVRQQNSKNSIAGGGRYDNSVGKFLAKTIPAVGISFGLERVTELASIKAEGAKAIIISINQDSEASKLAKKLRKESVSCILATDSPGKALEYANAYQIPFAIFIGKDELAMKRLKIRNMLTGEERLLMEKSVIRELK